MPRTRSIYILIALLSYLALCSGFLSSPGLQSKRYAPSLAGPQDHISELKPLVLASSFFGKFESDDEDEDDEDDDDDDDEYADLDDAAVANFRSRMSNLFGDDTATDSTTPNENEPESPSVSSSIDDLISYARSQSGGEEKPVVDWAKPADGVETGVVLVANPAKFCVDFAGKRYVPSPTLLSKFGLTLPPPRDLGPDRRADLLPVLILVECNSPREARAVLLNRRTGYLLGDLEQPPADESSSSSPAAGPAPILEKFCIQPLWFGGVDNVSSGLDMLHQCATVIGAKPITEDGLYWGGDPAQAQDAMSDPALDRVMTGFDFKFFVQSTIWTKKEIEKEIKAGTWFTAHVSKEVLFKSRDRMGTRRAKPLWTEIMELMGGEFKEVRDLFYEES